MESVKKIKQFIFFSILAIAFFTFSACKTPVVPPLVFQEVTPIPRSVVRAQTTTEYEPVYSVLRIVEISEVNGVQKYFLVRTGSDRTGIEVDATGDIGEDALFQRIIGNFKIIEIHGNFFRCEVNELAYRIGSNAHIRIQIGEQVKEAASR